MHRPRFTLYTILDRTLSLTNSTGDNPLRSRPKTPCNYKCMVSLEETTANSAEYIKTQKGSLGNFTDIPALYVFI